MRGALDEIGTSIPFRALRRISVVWAAVQEQQLPAREQRTNVEREW
jgi:hypothetical protein